MLKVLYQMGKLRNLFLCKAGKESSNDWSKNPIKQTEMTWGLKNVLWGWGGGGNNAAKIQLWY